MSSIQCCFVCMHAMRLCIQQTCAAATTAGVSISVSILLSEFLAIDDVVVLSSGSPAHCGQAAGNIYICICITLE